MTPEPVVQISAIEHFVYCPRQCALIHCDGVWSDNAHTVRGSRAHRRVDSGEHRQERGRQVLRAIPLWSEELGLSGRADAVEVEGDAVRPVEYKAGVRHGSAADLQLCAQALCLEEMLDVEIPHGYVWYGGPRRRLAGRLHRGAARRRTGSHRHDPGAADDLRAARGAQRRAMQGVPAPAPLPAGTLECAAQGEPLHGERSCSE